MTDPRVESCSHVTWASRRLLAIAIVTLVYCAIFWRSGLHLPDLTSSLIYFRNFTRGEPLIALGITLWLFWIRGVWTTNRADATTVEIGPLSEVKPLTIPLIVVLGLLPPLIIGAFVGRGFPIAMDEYGSWLQARLIRDGELVGRLPDAWVTYSEALTPVFVQAGSSRGEWILSYLPGYSIMLAIADMAGVGAWLNPLLNTVALTALWGIARRRWPQDVESQSVAVLTLALCTQFQLTGTTLYSMPAHLALNMVWLWCYTRDGAAKWALGPLGFFASILHQPIPHPLFVLPFLFRMARKGRWAMLAYVSAWYVAAIVVFLVWSGIGGGAKGAPFGIPTTANAVVLVMHVITILTWQTPVAGLLLLISLRRWSALDEIDHDLFGGVALSLLLYFFFTLVTQGHGYGWRYGHQVLGNVALLSATSWRFLRDSLNQQQIRTMVMSSLLVTCVVQVPWRTLQGAQLARPFITAHEWLAAQRARVVVVPTDSVWYGRDLIRNTPDLPTPVLMNEVVFDRIRLQGTHLFDSVTVRRISVTELQTLGLERLPSRR